jgi:hypothetical protein
MTRKEKQEAAQEKRAKLHIELMCIMQDKYRDCIDHGEKPKQALDKAGKEVLRVATEKAKACPQEKSFVEGVVTHIFHQLAEGLKLKLKMQEAK